ncbi:hypothetical protein LCGC14_0142120 [marine sediment metagenome]|uniref:Uncharacterized protein n=1 Tax=marine sediment metagenome TaxID=412755 RepID=A0A0F9VGK7_9ZZZZ
MVLKRLVARFCRWIRRTFQNFCVWDLKEDAQGLGDLLNLKPTEEQKAQRLKEQLLFGVDECDREKVLAHFDTLSQEPDPMENIKEIPPDSVKVLSTTRND